MGQVLTWVGWTEGMLVGTCVLALGMLYGNAKKRW
jgi:hypothetical protein